MIDTPTIDFGKGPCACGAQSVFGLYDSLAARDRAFTQAGAAGMTYRFIWTDAYGYGLCATHEHRHLSQRCHDEAERIRRCGVCGGSDGEHDWEVHSAEMRAEANGW